MKSNRFFLLAGILAFLCSFSAQAQNFTYLVLLDTDRNSATGCAVSMGAQTVPGIEQRIQATVDATSRTVTQVTQAVCNGASFGSPVVVGGSAPIAVGLNIGVGGSDVVEFDIPALNNGVIRLTVLASDGEGTDILATSDGGTGGSEISFEIRGSELVPVPALSTLGLLILSLGLCAVFLIYRRFGKHWLLLSLICLAGIVVAANHMSDGANNDWAGSQPAATDPCGDSTNGNSGNDIAGFFIAQEGNKLFFRVDVCDIENQGPTANPDAHSVLEDQPLSVAAPGVLGNDSDTESDPLTAVLGAGPSHAQSFSLNADGSFNYTPNADFNGADSFTYKANDGSTDSSPATVTITVDPVNDAPVVSAATFSVAENSADNTVVGNVTATDPDAGQTNTFSITAGNTGGAFAIDAGTGQITVNTMAALNIEATPTFNLTVQASDNGTPNLNGSATITINLTDVNEAPAVNAATFSIPENSANGTVVGTVTASDVDLPAQTLTFAITAGNTGNAFAINPASGQITADTVAALDFETNPTFNLTVQATDNGSPNLNGSATITINLSDVNDAPVVNTATFSVAENSANGAVVGTVTATDVDLPAQTLTYAITTGNTGGAFAIDSATGQITVNTMAALDFETNPTFNLTVQATDNGSPNLNGSATITINLTNVNEAPVVSAATFSIAENSANGTVVGTVAASDIDLPAQTLTFAITAGDTGGVFAIDPNNGQITVNTMAALNFETTPTFNLTVQATDNGAPNLNGSATITINLTNVNEAPVVSAATFSIAENSANGTVVDAVAASDADLPAQTLTFAITAGNTGNAFAINPGSGQITVDTAAALNFETNPTFNLTVQATDNGSPNLNGSATITINLTNVNEAPSAVDDATVVAEGGTVAALSMPLFAESVLENDTDADAGDSLFVTTTPVSGPAHASSFTLNADGTFSYTHNGTETTSDSFIYEVCDNAPTPLCDTATVTITINPVNDPPVLSVPASFAVTEDVPEALTGISASDVDAGGGNMLLTLEVDLGMLAATSGSGVTVGGSATNLTLSGALADLNAFMPNVTFTSDGNSGATPLTTGMTPRSVAAVDLDGDGLIDLVTANTGSNNVSVFRNTSSGSLISYNPKIDFAVGPSPVAVAIGDLDQDSKPDLVIANSNGNTDGPSTVSVLRNTSTPGSISFAGQVTFAVGDNPTSVVIGELDGDGKKDIAVSNGDGDGLPPQTVSVYRNTGTTGSISFAAEQTFAVGSKPGSIAIGDLDGDGLLDLATANSDPINNVVVDPDTVSVLRNTSTIGSISFAAQVTFDTGDAPQSIAIGDLDGDNKPEMIVGNTNEIFISIFRNTSTIGTVGFAARVDFNTEGGTKFVDIGDFNGDNQLDIASTASNVGQIKVFQNTSSVGSISLAAPLTFAVGQDPFSLTIADLDGDTHPNLAVANRLDNTVSLFDNQCTSPPCATIQLLPFNNIPLQVTINDNGNTGTGGAQQDSGTSNLIFTSLNDAPSGADNTVTTNEDSDYTFTAADFGFTDPNDSQANSLSSVRFTTLPGVGSLRRSGATFAAGTNILFADINAGNLKFTPVANGNGSPYDSFTFQVRDDGGTANGGVNLDPTPNTITIVVTAINDAPVIDMPGAEPSYSGSPVILDDMATVEDIDSPNFDTGTLTADVTANCDDNDNDRIGVRNEGMAAGQISSTLTAVSYNPGSGPVQIGTIATDFDCGNGTPSLVVTLDPDADPTATQALLRNLTYSNAATPTGTSRTVSVVLTDGDGGTSNMVDKTVNLDSPPQVQSADPSNAAIKVAIDKTISLTFTETVAIDTGVATLDCGGPVTFTTTPGLPAASTLTFTIDPSSNLPEGASCTLTLDSTKVTDTDAIDPPNELDGNSSGDGTDGDADNYVLTFTTDDAPTVTSTSPTDAATGITINSNISVNLSEAVDVTATGATINCAPGGSVAFSGLPVSNATSFMLDPASDLPAGATCTVTVVANQVEDTDDGDPPNQLDGNNDNDGADGGGDNYVFSFQTDAAPTATGGAPTNGATQVGINTNITFIFDENVDETGGTAITLNCGGPIAGTVSGSGSNTLSFTPSASLPLNTSCTATAVAANIKDSDTIDPPDNLAAPVVRSFTTDAAPSVGSTSPSTPNAAPTSNITVNFTEFVNFDTTPNAANNSFDLECPSATPVNFTVMTPSPAMSVTLNPDDNSIAGQSCTLSVRASGITDQDAGDPPDNMAVDHVAALSFGSLANDDSYNVTPHLTLNVDTMVQSGRVTANDVLGAGAITGFGFAPSCNATAPGSQHDGGAANGRLTLNANGSFSYEPFAGVASATRTFCYTVTGGDTANIVFNIQDTELVWFVDAACDSVDVNGCGVGNQAQPFKTLAAATGPDTPNDTIFVAHNPAGYTCGITLTTGERLIGEGSDSDLQILSGITPVTGSAFPPLTVDSAEWPILTASANCVTLASGGTGNNTIRGFLFGDVGAANAALISGPTFGTLTMRDATINTNGRAFALTSGAVDVDIGSVTSNFANGKGVDLSVVAGTFVTSSVTVTNAGNHGIHLANSSGTFNFGTVNIDTTASALHGFFIQGGTPTVQAGSVTIDQAGGRGFLMQSVGGSSGVTFTTVNIQFSAQEGIFVTGSSAPLTINGGTLQNNGGSAEIYITGSTSNISYAGTSTDPSGIPVYVESSTAGTKTFSGAISGARIGLSSNSGATINFMGGISLSSGGLSAFNATGGGTINVCDDNPCNPAATGPLVNTITTTTGVALNVQNTTIGANNLEFRSISAGTGTGSAGVGISLDGTGIVPGNGGLTVTGTGAPGSGGTIQHKTGADNSTTAGIGIFLKDTRNPSFNWMQLNDFDNSAIVGRNVQGFTLQNSVLNGVIGNNSAPVEGPINFGLSNPSGTNGLQGTGLIRNVRISGGIEHHVEFYNQSGSMNLTIDGSSAVSEGANPNSPADDVADCIIEENTTGSGSDGIQVEMQGTASATVVIDRCLFRDNKSQAVQLQAIDSATITATIDESWTRKFDQGNEGFLLSNSSNADATSLMSNNHVNNYGGAGFFVGQSGSATNSSLLNATISNNIMTQPATATNHGIIAFLTSEVGNTSQARLRIDGNNVTNNSTVGTTRGILVDTPDGGRSPAFDVTDTNNSVAVGDNVAGVAGNVVQSRNSSDACANIGSNTVTFPNGTPGGVLGLRARQANTALYDLEANASCSGTPAAVLACRNPASTTEVLGTLTVVAAGSCQLPATP